MPLIRNLSKNMSHQSVLLPRKKHQQTEGTSAHILMYRIRIHRASELTDCDEVLQARPRDRQGNDGDAHEDVTKLVAVRDQNQIGRGVQHYVGARQRRRNVRRSHEYHLHEVVRGHGENVVVEGQAVVDHGICECISWAQNQRNMATITTQQNFLLIQTHIVLVNLVAASMCGQIAITEKRNNAKTEDNIIVFIFLSNWQKIWQLTQFTIENCRISYSANVMSELSRVSHPSRHNTGHFGGR